MSLCPIPLNEAVLPDGFCVSVIPVSISRPRGASGIGSPSDILVLERGLSRVALLHDSDGDLTPDMVLQVAEGWSLNHGVAVHNDYVYASSDSTVYRWPYTPGDSSSFPAGGWGPNEAEVVIRNINEGGEGSAGGFAHWTRSLAFDNSGMLYVQIGSQGNVDYSSYRARVRRFDISDDDNLPLDFTNGDVFADGLRNTVGLAFDAYGDLWGVDNGGDLHDGRPDLDIDIVFADEPADEMNRLSEYPGGNWGFPYCWTEYNLPSPPGLGAGTPWAWPLFLSDNLGGYTDEWCRDNTLQSTLALYPHSAALGITFFEWRDETAMPAGCSGGFPREMDGYAFISFHGSYRVTPATGYKVVYVEMDNYGNPVGSHIDLLAHEPPNAVWPNFFRPVDVVFDECGRLLVTSDTGAVDIVRISYSPPPTAVPVSTSTNFLSQQKTAPVPKCGSIGRDDGFGGEANKAKDCGNRRKVRRKALKGS